MTDLNNEVRELDIDELDEVSGSFSRQFGAPIYTFACNAWNFGWEHGSHGPSYFGYSWWPS